MRVKKDSRVLFGILSCYRLFLLWFAPIFVWNMIYLILDAQRRRRESGNAS